MEYYEDDETGEIEEEILDEFNFSNDEKRSIRNLELSEKTSEKIRQLKNKEIYNNSTKYILMNKREKEKKMNKIIFQTCDNNEENKEFDRY